MGIGDYKVNIMTAKDIISIQKHDISHPANSRVDSDMPLIDVIPRLLDSKNRELTVIDDEGHCIGTIDQTSLLEGIGRMIAPRDDCSVITLDCAPEEYSASVLSHAVEDSDAHLVDLFSVPGENSRINVTLRVRHSDPTAAVRSLERYGFNVVEAHSAGNSMQSMEIATERLLSLQALMNV